MPDFIRWCGFVGAWLLMAGPVYQASLELQEESFESDRIRALTSAVQPPPPVSQWWWLLPPIRFALAQQRSRRYRQLLVDAMTDEDYDQLTSFFNKATGWVLVGAGAFLLALTDTYALTHEYGWPIAVFWVLALVMAGGCFGYSAARTSHVERERARRSGADDHERSTRP